jgi:putative membrane protein
MVFLPAMLYISINFARKKEIKKHIISQSLILAISLVFILYFELMVRIDGGFIKYINNDTLPFGIIVIYMIIHILIAIVAVGGWLFLFIKSLKEYKQKDFKTFSFNHKKIGQAIFIALSVSVLMGTIIYLALFIV